MAGRDESLHHCGNGQYHLRKGKRAAIVDEVAILPYRLELQLVLQHALSVDEPVDVFR